MVYIEKRKRNGGIYLYLSENIRYGKNKWKQFRKYIRKGNKTKKEIEYLKSKYSSELKDKIRIFEERTDPLKKLIGKEDIKKIDGIKKKYSHKINSMDKVSKQKYDEWFTTEFTYNSNTIEGSTINLRETALILYDKISPSNKTIKEIREVENHKTAFDFIKDYSGTFCRKFILDIHKKLMYNILGKNAGVFRNVQVYIRGVEKQELPPKPDEIEREFKKLMRWYRTSVKKYHPLIRISYFHIAFEGIHPFIDGNGRTGRLILNYMLKKENYPPVNIENKNKEEYYSALRDGLKGNLSPFIKMLINYLEKSAEY